MQFFKNKQKPTESELRIFKIQKLFVIREDLLSASDEMKTSSKFLTMKQEHESSSDCVSSYH